MRPRSPLAWATLIYPCIVVAVVVGTANHFFLDAVVGIGCVAIGVAGALLVHGRVPRGRPAAGPLGIALAGVGWGAVAFALNVVVMSFAS
jgi:hypothetical protein